LIAAAGNGRSRIMSRTAGGKATDENRQARTIRASHNGACRLTERLSQLHFFAHKFSTLIIFLDSLLENPSDF
jgi:hypothetical protein